jgi:lipopolysaccharide assembly outer membrane protein LptD (OstA)
MRLALLCAVALATGLGVPRQAQAQAEEVVREPVHVTADHLEYEAERELFIAEGNVRIVSGDRSIEADWLVVSRDTEQGIASGNVVYRDGNEELHSELLQFEVETLQGLVYQGHLDTGDGGFVVDADRLIRNGAKNYTVRAGSFTTCRCPEGEREPWSIFAGKADVEIGGYAMAQNTTVDILGVPIIWLPWLIFPVKTERESGVLFPNLGFRGQAGFEVGLPLFWAAQQNVGVLATPIYMTKRGFKQNIEVEALIGEESRANIFAAFGRDALRADEKPTNGSRHNEDRISRWAVLAHYDQRLPRSWRAKADLTLISDNEYTADYEELSPYRKDLFLQSTIFGFRQFGRDGRLGVVGSVVHLNDLQVEDSRDRDQFVHHQLPALRAEILSGPTPFVKGLVTRFEFDYANYYARRSARDEFAAALVGDDLFLDVGVDGGIFPGFEATAVAGASAAGEDNGVFDEGELLADQGHRFVLHPRVAYPLRLWDTLELYPEVGYRETLYTSRAQNFAEQGHLTARFDLSTRLIGNPGGGSLRHVLEPSLGWSFVGNASSAGVPLFVPAAARPQDRLRQFERDNLLTDPSDRVNRRHTVTAGVANRLYAGGRLRGELNLSFDRHLVGNGTRRSVTKRERDFSRFVLAGESTGLYRVNSRFNLSYDPKRDRVEEGLFSLYVVPWSWISLHAGYRYRAPIAASTARYFSQINDDDPWDEKTSSLSQLLPGVTLRLGSRLRLTYSTHYDFHERSLLTQQGGFEYRSKCNCWAIGLEIQRLTDNEIRYQLRYSLLGAGDENLRAGAFANSASLDEF